MILPAARPQVLDFFGTSLVFEPAAGQFSSDPVLLRFRQLDERLGRTSRPCSSSCAIATARARMSTGTRSVTRTMRKPKR
jgi:hypothetical protein